MAKCLIKEGLFGEVDELFISMEKYKCSPNCTMLNSIVGGLLEQGEPLKATEFLHKMSEQHFAVEASTAKLLLDLLSEDGGYEKYMKLIPDFATERVKSNSEITIDIESLNLDPCKGKEK